MTVTAQISARLRAAHTRVQRNAVRAERADAEAQAAFSASPGNSGLQQAAAAHRGSLVGRSAPRLMLLMMP